MSFSPSYITKNRFGVFYFRCRIPIEVRKRYNLPKTEVKKSLKTGNRKEALRLARILWVDMANKNFIPPSPFVDDFDIDEIERHDRLLIGRKLLEKINNITDNANYLQDDVDSFFIRLTDYDKEAMNLYGDYLARRDEEKQAQHNDDAVEQKIENVVKTGVKPYLTELIMNFYEEHKKGWKSDRTWEKDVKPTLYAFVEIVRDKRADELTIDDIVIFKNNYKKLPKRYTLLKKYREKSIQQIINMPTILDKDRQAPKTIKKKYDIVKQFLDWMDDNNYLLCSSNDMKKPLKQDTKKDRIKGGEQSFTNDELKALFESKEYTVKRHKHPSHHWVPLIGLYTGARLGEICQLRKVDVVKDEATGIWYFNFCDYDEKSSLKTDAGERKMPVHSQLEKLGFLDFVKGVRNGKRLFEELKYTKGNRYSGAMSKWFGRYRKKCGVDGSGRQRKVFHSFRNTLLNRLKQNGVDVLLAKEMVGHIIDDLTYGSRGYGYADELGLKQKKKYLEKVKYDIDFSLYRKMRWGQREQR